MSKITHSIKQSFSTRLTENTALIWVVAISLAFCIYLGFERTHFSFGVETDFLGGFLPEAKRILRNEPLLLSFHPPFYSYILAGVYTFTENWLTAGITISLISFTIILLVNFYLFEKACARYSGWAVVAGFLISTPFIIYTCFATSDVFFLALYSTTIYLAYIAYNSQFTRTWSIAGFILGLAILTRSNSITLLALLLLPWLLDETLFTRLKRFLVMLLGLCIPIFIWAGIAKYTGSPILPEGNHINIALTYFSPGQDRISVDARLHLEEKFNNLWQVLSHDPVHMTKTYFRDLINNKVLRSNELLPFPINYLALIAFLFSLYRKPIKSFWYFIISITALQVLLINFKAYDVRFYFFIIPVVTAPIALLLTNIFHKLNIKANKKYLLYTIIILMALINFKMPSDVFKVLHKYDYEIKDVLDRLAYLKDNKNITIVARKPQIPHHLGVNYLLIPKVKNINELRDYIENNSVTEKVYLYFGSYELKTRPQLSFLLKSQNSIFHISAQSQRGDLWTLYEYKSP